MDQIHGIRLTDCKYVLSVEWVVVLELEFEFELMELIMQSAQTFMWNVDMHLSALLLVKSIFSLINNRSLDYNII